METINDGTVYQEASKAPLSGWYYFVSWKAYLKNESFWWLVLAVPHLYKMQSIFYKNGQEKLIATFMLLYFVLPKATQMIRQTVKLTTKQKQHTEVTIPPSLPNEPRKQAKKASFQGVQ